jgi:Tol biopolymer transport system component
MEEIKMKLRKLLISLVIVSLLVSMVIPMASAPKPDKPPGKPGGEEPPADPAIAYRIDDNIIKVMNADGSNQAVIVEMEDFSMSRGLSWSPDGNSIAWTGFSYVPNVPGGWIFGVWRVDVEIIDGVPQGTNLQQLTVEEGDDEFLSSVAWSPLGDEIAYMVHRWDTTHVYSIEAVSTTGGTPYVIYTAPEGEGLMISNGLAWSSDGTQLAACGGEIPAGYDGASIMIIDRASGTVTDRLLTGQYHKGGLNWARQGVNEILFHDSGGTGMIYTVDIDTENVVPVVEGSNPSWSPDNYMIVYMQRINRKKISISTYEFSTGTIIQLANNGVTPDWRR